MGIQRIGFNIISQDCAGYLIGVHGAVLLSYVIFALTN